MLRQRSPPAPITLQRICKGNPAGSVPGAHVQRTDQKQPQHGIKPVVHAKHGLLDHTVRFGKRIPVDEFGTEPGRDRIGPGREAGGGQYPLGHQPFPAPSITHRLDLLRGGGTAACRSIQPGPAGMGASLHGGIVTPHHHVH